MVERKRGPISKCPRQRPCRALDLWKGLKTIGIVISLCLREGKETSETRYYLSSLPLGVKQFAHAVRSHWAIENTCHWSLDVTYREDESRIRDRNVRENFAWLNRFTLSLLKQHPSKESLASVCPENTFMLKNMDFLEKKLLED